VRAAPAVSRANAHKENAHEHTGSAEAVRPSLRNGFNGFLRALPGDRALCHRYLRKRFHKRDASVEASGPHDFAVRFKRSSSESAKASTASRPTFVTMANAPLSGETAAILPVICGSNQSRNLRRINTTGKSVGIEKFVSTEQQLLRADVMQRRIAQMPAMASIGFRHPGGRAFHLADIAKLSLQA
jgi:hypothetical protein